MCHVLAYSFLQGLPIPRRMQQSQVIVICILSGSCGEKVAYIDIKEERGQDQPLKETISQTLKVAVSGGEGKACMRIKLLRVICRRQTRHWPSF